MPVVGSKPPMSNCVTYRPLAENVRGLYVCRLKNLVHAHCLGTSTVVLSDSRYTSPSVFGSNGSLWSGS